jgi:DNA-binding XRE family transcriptional regulator
MQKQRKSPRPDEPRKATGQSAYAVLKSEISRIARKEVRAATLQLRKQSANYRSQIASLKRQVAALDKQIRRPSKMTRPISAAPEANESASGLRFRAKGFAAHRRRLGLSAAQAGALLGVSGQSIYHWETGKAKPRASQMPAIAALRKLSRTQAADAVTQVMG